MAHSSHNELFSVLTAFSPALRSFDIKTVAVRSSNGEEWQNLITSIICRTEDKAEIEEEHKKLPIIRNDQFAIFLKASSFDYEIFD